MSQLQDTQRRHFGLGFFRWKNGWIVDGVFHGFSASVLEQ
jgi:hypothetical protein